MFNCELFMCMCLVLFVVSQIPESSRLLSCFFLYEIRLECNLLFERSEFLISTCEKKKTDRPDVCMYA